MLFSTFTWSCAFQKLQIYVDTQRSEISIAIYTCQLETRVLNSLVLIIDDDDVDDVFSLYNVFWDLVTKAFSQTMSTSSVSQRDVFFTYILVDSMTVETRTH